MAIDSARAKALARSLMRVPYRNSNQADFMSKVANAQPYSNSNQADFMSKVANAQPLTSGGDVAVNSGKVNQPMPPTGFGDASGFANNVVTPANSSLNSQASSAGLNALGSAGGNYIKPVQSKSSRPVSRGKLSQLAPTPRY